MVFLFYFLLNVTLQKATRFTEGYGKVKYNTADIKNIASLQKNAYLFSDNPKCCFSRTNSWLCKMTKMVN